MNIEDLLKAKKFTTNIRDVNIVVLDDFKKEIAVYSDSKTHFNTLVYDNRIKNCDTILEALEMQIPKSPIIESWSPALCPLCGEELSDSLGDGYYQHWYSKKICGCGQRLKWEI